jgi:hypothetical protein
MRPPGATDLVRDDRWPPPVRGRRVDAAVGPRVLLEEGPLPRRHRTERIGRRRVEPREQCRRRVHPRLVVGFAAGEVFVHERVRADEHFGEREPRGR